MALNKTILHGRLVKDIELKMTQTGKPVCAFTLAVDRDYKAEGQPTADFINCVAWNHTAEFLNRYFRKGQEMILTGALQVRTYQGSDGVKKYVTEVVAASVDFCGPKQEAADEPTPNPYDGAGAFESVSDDDDLPF